MKKLWAQATVKRLDIVEGHVYCCTGVSLSALMCKKLVERWSHEKHRNEKWWGPRKTIRTPGEVQIVFGGLVLCAFETPEPCTEGIVY